MVAGSGVAQQEAVARQFGSRAASYLSSDAHARGDDLAQLAALARARPSARALDLGCGAGHASFALAPGVRDVVAFDLSDDMLHLVASEATRRGLGNLATRQGAVERLPFDDRDFDILVSRFSGHHWRDLQAGLAEARRVLQPHGTAVFIDVVAPPDPLLDSHLQAIELLRDPTHVRDYTEAEWRSSLARHGMPVAAHRGWRLRMHFDAWVSRSATPVHRREAVRALIAESPAEVARHFAIGEDQSFDIDVAMFVTAGA